MKLRFSLAAFLMDGCMGMFTIALPLFARDLKLTVFQTGLAVGAATLPYIVVCVLAGKASERWGRRAFAIAGTTGIAVCYFLVATATGPWSLILACSCVGTTQALFWAPFQSWIGDSYPRPRLMKALMLLNLSWSSGMMAGWVVGGHLYGVGGQLVFHIAGLICFLNGLLVCSIPCAAPNKQGEPITCNNPDSPHPAHNAYVLAHRIANFVSYFTITTVVTYFALLAREMGFFPSEVGNRVLFVGLAEVAAFACMGSWRGWRYKRYPVIISQVAAFAGMSGIALGLRGWILVPCVATAGLMLGVSYTASLYYSVTSPEAIGEKAGWHESVLRMGNFLGGVLGGWVGRGGDLRMPFALCAAVIMVGMGSYIAAAAKRRAIRASARV